MIIIRMSAKTLLLYCCSFFSSFCCLLLLITASGLLMLRVKDVSGSSGGFKDKSRHKLGSKSINVNIYCGEDKLKMIMFKAWPTFQSALCLQKFFFAKFNLQSLKFNVYESIQIEKIHCWHSLLLMRSQQK